MIRIEFWLILSFREEVQTFMYHHAMLPACPPIGSYVTIEGEKYKVKSLYFEDGFAEMCAELEDMTFETMDEYGKSCAEHLEEKRWKIL